MTLSDLVNRLSIGVMRDDLAISPGYASFINEALTEVQRRRSWQVMKQVEFFTMPNGSSTITLAYFDPPANTQPTNFKELTLQESPIHLKAQDLVLTPCDVWTMEKVLRRQARLISNSLLYSVYMHPDTTRRVSIPVWVDWINGQPSLNILFAADSDLPFQVSYYAYLPDLVNNTDHNEFTDRFPEMVIDKAKALAFASINDPIAADFEALFEKKFSDAAAKDAYQAVAGLQLRM
jgi:hypothetical protein